MDDTDSQDPVFACLLTIQREGGHEELKVLLKELSRINLGVPSDIASQLSNSCEDEEMKSLLDSLAQVWSPTFFYFCSHFQQWRDIGQKQINFCIITWFTTLI